MNQVEKQILENLFDSLDRLFDKECTVIDLYSLLYASEQALGESTDLISLHNYTTELKKIVQSGMSEQRQREEALNKTDNLRSELNDLLPI